MRSRLSGSSMRCLSAPARFSMYLMELLDPPAMGINVDDAQGFGPNDSTSSLVSNNHFNGSHPQAG